MFVRSATHAYQDPLEHIWIRCAQRIGFEIVRTPEAYASFDGKGRILIATADQFDPDDNLGQMIFHELCHALVQGEEGELEVDWGLDNTRIGHPWREHACLRAQAWLGDQYGLREFLAPTTDYRVSFWNRLGDNPLDAPETEGGFRERSVVAARLALTRSQLPRWRQPLKEALLQTQQIARVLSEAPSSASDPDNLPSLWSTFKEGPTRHSVGIAAILPTTQNPGCAACAWSFHHRGALRCRHAPQIRLSPNEPACAAFESRTRLDCQTCGACCREAYDSVEVSERDPVRKSHPEMVIRQGGRLKLRRENTRCAALAGGRTAQEPYSCSIYPGRPRTCRDFTQGSENCLAARRKVGLSL
ncbi:MAG TPA: YkgJ family cysteine cluster protein [Methylococcaceae bacterium]|nr:YkgJ family cysteine cluster protein [Methylococcaceae bacterium]